MLRSEMPTSAGPLDRRKFLRHLAGAAVAVPVLSTLGACGAVWSGADNGGPDDEVDELVVPVNSSPWLAAYRSVAREYERVSGVRVTLRVFPYDGLRTAMVNAALGGTKPFDLYHLDEPWTGEFYSNNWVTPFREIDPSFRMDDRIARFNDVVNWDAATRRSTPDADVVALPIQGSMTIFMYRKDLYRELGLTVPTTFEAALANARAARASGRVPYGYVARGQATRGGQSITYDFMPVLYGYGGGWFDPQWKSIIDRPEAVAAVQMYKDLLAEGPPNSNSIALADVIAAVQKGQALQAHGVASAAFQLNDPQKSLVAGEVGFAPMPAGAGGRSVPTSNVWSLTVPRGLPPARQRAALRYASWLLGRQAQTSFAKAGGIPTRTDAFDPAGVPETSREVLSTVSRSLPGVRSALRYPFAARMASATETTLSAIVSGQRPVADGLAQLAAELDEIARRAGYES